MVTMKKEEFIKRYGEEAYKRKLKRGSKEAIIARIGEEEYKKKLERGSKEAIIERYGAEEYKRRLEQNRKRNTKEAIIERGGEEAYERELNRKRKEEYIARYGEESYKRQVERNNKEEFIKRYGEDAYKKRRELTKKWRKANPEKAKAQSIEACRKGGKHYEKSLEYQRTGLQGARNIVRSRHGRRFRKYKRFFAQEAQIHHEWIPKTAEYTGLALVEADAHRYGIIDVIEILDGKITLLTEEKIKKKKKQK